MAEIQIVKLRKEEFEEWNRFVDLSPQGDVFCYSWWLDAVTKSRFIIYAVRSGDEIVAGMPLALDRNGKVNEPHLTRTLGVLYKPQQSLPEHKQISNQRKWVEALLTCINPDNTVQFCTHSEFKDWLPLRWIGFKQTTRYTYIIRYDGLSSDSLWLKLNGGRKNSITRAVKRGIRVKETDDLKSFYDLVHSTYQRQGMKFWLSLEELACLDDAIMKNGRRVILAAIDELNVLHAAIYVICFRNRSAFNLLSGSNPEYRSLGGHTLVLWEAIRYFMDKVEFFNFGGSNIERIEEHFRGFGGKMIPYFHIYNEKLLNDTSIRYHLNQIGFHLTGSFRALYGSLKKFLIKS